jgi:hypothetical protein
MQEGRRIESCGRLGVNRQGDDILVGQTGVDASPTDAPIGALQDAVAVVQVGTAWPEITWGRRGRPLRAVNLKMGW